jgi:hypothetical protein
VVRNLCHKFIIIEEEDPEVELEDEEPVVSTGSKQTISSKNNPNASQKKKPKKTVKLCPLS